MKLKLYFPDSRWISAGILILFALFWTNILPLKAPFSGQMIPDSRSYLLYSQHVSEHVMKDTIRTPGYPLFLFCAEKWSTLFHVSFLKMVFLLQTGLFLLAVFLLSEIIRKISHNALAVCFVVIIGLNPSFFIYNFLVLTEPLFFFLVSLSVYHLFQFYENRKPVVLCLSLLYSCLATLTRPGFYYLNVLYVLLLLIFLWRKKYMLHLGICLMIYGGSILLFQVNFYHHHKRFKLSMIDDITRHRYLRNAVSCFMSGKDMTEELRIQDSIDEGKIRRESLTDNTLKLSEYYKEQWNQTTTGHTAIVLKVMAMNIFSNIHTGNTLLPEYMPASTRQTLFNVTRVWNMVYIWLFILFSLFYFIRFILGRKVHAMIYVFICFVFYQILTCGVSFWQGDRLLISCQPFITVIIFIFLHPYGKIKPGPSGGKKMMKRISFNLLLITILFFLSAFSLQKPLHTYPANCCDSIHVWKSKKIMTLYAGTHVVATYDISVGMSPKGHKQKQGDNRTPEGIYFINDKNLHSRYYKNLGISYPNNQDRKKALQNHVRTGGDIKIHGFADGNGRTNSRNTKFLYTWGCIGVTNSDMDEIFYLVKQGAVIVIEP